MVFGFRVENVEPATITRLDGLLDSVIGLDMNRGSAFIYGEAGNSGHLNRILGYEET